MKGLSMTLSIVIVAIVLLVTALVIMTIFGGSMAQFMGVLNPWQKSVLEQNLCQQACSAKCMTSPPPASANGIIGWATIKVDTQDGKKDCSTIMNEISPEGCKCKGILPSSGTP